MKLFSVPEHTLNINLFPKIEAKPLAEKIHSNEILYHAKYLAQLDGQVAYVPALSSTTGYLILVENNIAEIFAIRFTASQVAIVDPFIKHSMPIPLNGTLEFTAWHRSVFSDKNFIIYIIKYKNIEIKKLIKRVKYNSILYLHF